MKNITTAIIGLIILIVGAMLSVGKAEKIVEKFRKNKQEKQQKSKTREICLRAGELVMLDGLIFLMKGLFEGTENHMLLFAIIAWAIVACFDVLYVTVTTMKKKKLSEKRLWEIHQERNNRLAKRANKMGKVLEEEG